jgi:putative hydroxymethylpyrimidine transport system ATP-binding protein
MIKINNLYFAYENSPLIEDFTLEVKAKEIVTIIGPSGCGKSSLIKLISGQLDNQNKNITLLDNHIGYQSQKNTLLPWYTIYENITLPLNIQNQKIDPQYINTLLATFDLTDYQNHYPKQLSGGMLSKANLLKTFIIAPNLILLDEPFTGIDTITKYKLTKWLRKTLKDQNKTSLYITHDYDEAINISDKIIIVSQKPMKTVIELTGKEITKENIFHYLSL